MKRSKVVFISDKLERIFESMSEEDVLKKHIKRAMSDMNENAFVGIILEWFNHKDYERRFGY